jgi:ribosomal protein S18 acetylase RimI-like enzyme
MFVCRMPGIMTDGAVKLMPLKIYNVRLLLSGLNRQDILKANAVSSLTACPVSLWWWIKKTFDLSRIIEHDGAVIGFIGLYDLRVNTSAKMSLVIFDREQRNRGYGSRAFHILTGQIMTSLHLQKIFVEVEKDNISGLAFWRRCGFHECKEEMTMELIP